MERSNVPPPVTRVLDAAEAWLPRRMVAVEERLGELTAAGGERLAGEAGATLAAGGKRLRPMLVLVCAGDDSGDGAIRAAAAVELIHMATLVHDDVLDSAPLRRGQPTVVARAGRADGDGGRRSVALARVRRARRGRRGRRAPGGAAGGGLGGPGAWRAGSAPRCLRPRDPGRPLPRALPAEDGPPLRVCVPDRPRRPIPRPPGPWRPSGGRSALPFSCSTTCSTSPARRSARARRSAPTCWTGPSPCR